MSQRLQRLDRAPQFFPVAVFSQQMLRRGGNYQRVAGAAGVKAKPPRALYV